MGWDCEQQLSIHSHSTGQGRDTAPLLFLYKIKTKRRHWVNQFENLEQEGESDVNFANQSLLALELSVTEKALGLRPKNR